MLPLARVGASAGAAVGASVDDSVGVSVGATGPSAPFRQEGAAPDMISRLKEDSTTRWKTAGGRRLATELTSSSFAQSPLGGPLFGIALIKNALEIQIIYLTTHGLSTDQHKSTINPVIIIILLSQNKKDDYTDI